MNIQIRHARAHKPIEELRADKLQELNDACSAAILGKFTTAIDGVSYSFSHDKEAQDNMKDAKIAWMDGELSETDTLPWTAYDSSGSVIRLNLTKDQFNQLYRAHLNIAPSNISKLRDEFEKKVNATQSPKDLDAIMWE